MEISAVIVNYFTADFLPQIIGRLADEPLITEIIVVDNSNELNSYCALKKMPNVEIVINQKNTGYGAAVNQGVLKTSGDAVLLVNPDMVFDNECITRLAKALMQLDTPFVGPRYYWDEARIFRLPPATGGSLWFDFAHHCSASFSLDARLFSFYWTVRHDRFWSETKPFAEPFLSGACLLIKRDWIKENQGKIFDERFFLYFEDTDLCSAALTAGSYPYCVPDAYVIHFYDQSPNPPNLTKLTLMNESRVHFMKKYYGEYTLNPLPGNNEFRDTHDLGALRQPPLLQWDKTQLGDEHIHIEISVNPWFVPFVQSIPITDSDCRFQFPLSCWENWAPLPYFIRARNPVSGCEKIWKFVKYG